MLMVLPPPLVHDIFRKMLTTGMQYLTSELSEEMLYSFQWSFAG